VFSEVRPANTTYYVGGLIPPGALVEVEIDAVVES
jgi:enamine deaminase RidA (YjgF/YER057c/UK114 family)